MKFNMTKEVLDIVSESVMAAIADKEISVVVGFLKPLSAVKNKVRVTKILFGKKGKKKWDGELKVTIGRVNYAERKYLRLCKKAKTSPRKFWIKYINNKRGV